MTFLALLLHHFVSGFNHEYKILDGNSNINFYWNKVNHLSENMIFFLNVSQPYLKSVSSNLIVDEKYLMNILGYPVRKLPGYQIMLSNIENYKILLFMLPQGDFNWSVANQIVYKQTLQSFILKPILIKNHNQDCHGVIVNDYYVSIKQSIALYTLLFQNSCLIAKNLGVQGEIVLMYVL